MRLLLQEYSQNERGSKAMTASESIIIIGAGHAGFHLALFLRQGGHQGRIKLINGELHSPYQRPPLSKEYLKGNGGVGTLSFRPGSFFDIQKIDLISGEAVAINRSEKTVGLSTGELVPYDHLVLATGARNRQLEVEGAENRVHYIRSLQEAERIRLRLASACRVAVVGAGFIGLEFAATARAKGLDVNIIERAPRVMERAVSPEVSAFFVSQHQKAGVRFHFNASVENIEHGNNNVDRLMLSSGQRIEADLIVAGVGVMPNTHLAVQSGLEVNIGIVVDPQLVTSDVDISAIGDCALFPSPHAEASVCVESVQNATDQARCVAARLNGRTSAYGALPWFWSDQGEHKLQIVGLASRIDQTVLRGLPTSNSFSVFCYRNGHLLRVESVNCPADHMVGRKILGMGRSVEPELAADPNFNLKALAA
jgi:3-phenylpropionate/trans-cinnamate dioxygenase ferredoxin reductase component